MLEGVLAFVVPATIALSNGLA